MFREVMNRRRLLLTLGGVGGAALLLRLLNSRDSTATITPTGDETVSDTPEAEPELNPGTNFVQLEVTCAENQLAFEPTTLVAPANGQISLTFHNVSAIFMHNWVLVNGGDDLADQILEAAIAVGPEQNYIPARTSDIIAHTKLVAGGESETITFAAPPAGEYTYLCTFPGHCLAGMRGVLTITPA
jgi:azurin